jgi:glutathione S-transferase
MPKSLVHQLNVAASTLSSTLGGWRGTSVVHAATQPPKPLALYDMEGSPACRRVREALTALGLDVQVWPCPLEGQRFAPKAKSLGGTPGQPVLVDPNGPATLTNAASIVEHLFQTYAKRATPRSYRAGATDGILGAAGALVRQQRGTQARASRQPIKPLALWSFESSPYSRLVRERLTELELPYTLHNLGKEQFADMGPAAMRVRPGPYRPKAGGKREKMLAQLGRVQVPYLEDPNTGVKMFESEAIIDYLERSYAL